MPFLHARACLLLVHARLGPQGLQAQLLRCAQDVEAGAAVPVPAHRVYTTWQKEVVDAESAITGRLDELRAFKRHVLSLCSAPRADGPSAASPLDGQLGLCNEIESLLSKCGELRARALAALPDAYAASINSFRIHSEAPAGEVPLRGQIDASREARFQGLWDSAGGVAKRCTSREDPELVEVKDFKTLRLRTWLGDVVLNVYFQRLLLRAAGRPVRVASSFFYTALEHPEQYEASTWLRPTSTPFGELFVDGCPCVESILVPINKDRVHWSLVRINFALKRLEYFDSLGYDGDGVLECIR